MPLQMVEVFSNQELVSPFPSPRELGLPRCRGIGRLLVTFLLIEKGLLS